MQTSILEILPQVAIQETPKRWLSFRPFIEYLKKRMQTGNREKNLFFSYVIEAFEQHSELLGRVDIHNMENYTRLMQLIYNILSPVIEDEESQLKAFCMPLSPSVFYSTDAFHKLVNNIKSGELSIDVFGKKEEDLQKVKKIAYALILERYYHIEAFFSGDIVHSLKDDKTGLMRYYKLQIDKRFIEVHCIGELPGFRIELLKSGEIENGDALKFLEQHLPLDQFEFEGFGITTLTDVTTRFAIENIKNIVLDHSGFSADHSYAAVVSSMKTLLGSNEIEFGILPILQVNNKLIFNDTNCHNSLMIRTVRKKGMAESVYTTLVEAYMKNPRLLLFREITNEDEEKKQYLQLLRIIGVNSYALIPVYFNNRLTGLLEIYSAQKGILNEGMLSRMELAIPLIAQLLKNTVDEFNNSVEKVIKEKFTSVQPSVQWKFNEVAWHYIRDTARQEGSKEIEDIIFNKVYPLYGAVDIRNSTVERNAALRKDMEIQLNALVETLEKIKSITGLGLIDEKIFNARKWLRRISDPNFNQELKLNDFMENEITPFLHELVKNKQGLMPTLESYFKVTDEMTGIGNENRRQLEKSMHTVIGVVNNYMDLLKEEVQKSYPCYFEKFRTDGVEYDIYIGQSIAPELTFSEMYLKNLRLLQLRSMAAIARHSHTLLGDLVKPVETTQLIFIHAHPIDIWFRKDEKRFDVEGTYNIRYHIIKKRIDKIRIKESKERLTQPDKIALVYFNQREADEYRSYIRFLQGDGILKDDLEFLDLEDLQGVNGLKAMRVGVVVE